MGENYLLGLFWILLAGITQGGFTLPMKYVRRWRWEHLWLAYSLIAFFVIPLVVALLTVPQLWKVYQQCASNVLWVTAFFGAGWGVGSVFFGLGVDALGMALGFSMATGIYTALGALIPMFVLTPDVILTTTGLLIILGNAVTVAGVILLAVAGDLRDKRMGSQAAPGTLNPKISFRLGLLICIGSGVFSAMFNFSYAFGTPIAEVARQFGATENGALNALWLVAIPPGGLLNIGYCMYLLQRRSTWPLLWRGTVPIDWFHALVMAVLWSGSVILYGWGASDLGRLGPSLGWSLWNTILIITTFVAGLLTREWEGASGRPMRLLGGGIAVLILASVILGLGGAGG